MNVIFSFFYIYIFMFKVKPNKVINNITLYIELFRKKLKTNRDVKRF
jgi:hypothetical protein